MTVAISPLPATLGATVSGVRLATLTEAEWRTIEQAFNEYAVLVFPGQFLSSADQVAFARRFGEIEHVVGTDGITDVSNQAPDGSLRPADHPSMQILRGNEGWHTDSSYMPISAKASMLSAHVVPAAGGETEWADMRDAYDCLDDGTKTRIGAMAAHHSIRYSQARIGFTDSTTALYGYQVSDEPQRPLVKVHPVTGRPALYIGRHAHAIVGLPDDESERLLDDLVAMACQPPRTYRHNWTVGDVVVWDNRCLLHRACPYDPTAVRVMKHTRIAGDPATERALQLSDQQW